MWEIEWPILLLGAVFGLGYAVAMMRQDSRSLAESAELYSLAVESIQHRDWFQALAFAYESIGKKPNHETYNLLGVVWGEMGQYGRAAGAFCDAWKIIWQKPGWREPAGKADPHLVKKLCFYYNAEALAQARNCNWKWAYIRANGVLSLIWEKLPGRCDDYESWARLIRMVAAINYLKGEAATNVSSKDARWLMNHSKVPGFEWIAESVVQNVGNEDAMRGKVNEEWLRYDIPRRGGKVIIDTN